MRVFSQLLVWVVGVTLHDIFSPLLILFTECFETLPARVVALGNHVHEKSVCPEECVHSPPSVERVRHSVCFMRRDTFRAWARVSATNRELGIE